MLNDEKKKFAFFGEHTPGHLGWRWWEMGNLGDQFDVVSTEERDRRMQEYVEAGHEVFEGLPDSDAAAEARLEEIEAEMVKSYRRNSAKVIIPYIAPACTHRLSNDMSARRVHDGVCTLCGGMSPIIGIFFVPFNECIVKKRKKP